MSRSDNSWCLHPQMPASIHVSLAKQFIFIRSTNQNLNDSAVMSIWCLSVSWFSVHFLPVSARNEPKKRHLRGRGSYQIKRRAVWFECDILSALKNPSLLRALPAVSACFFVAGEVFRLILSGVLNFTAKVRCFGTFRWASTIFTEIKCSWACGGALFVWWTRPTIAVRLWYRPSGFRCTKWVS